MGSSVSCISFSFRCPVVKVLHAGNGKISEVHESIKAAELMLENPNFFVIHSACLRNGQRVSPLSADEELKPAHVYILLPMRKLHSRLSPEETAALCGILSRYSIGKRRKRAQRKVTPVESAPRGMDSETVGVTESGEHGPTLLPFLRTHSIQLGSIGDLSMEMETPKMRAKQWIPKLETINESSILKV